MAKYEPQVIVQFADNLYRQAGSLPVSYAVLGVLLGAALGFALGGFFRAPEAAMIVAALGALLLGLVAFTVGQQKAFALRLQAQVALCQVQTEANTRAAGPIAERTA